MTKIEWCDATWNPISGCDRVSPGCLHCYAVAQSRRLATFQHTAEKYGGLVHLLGNGKTDWTGVVRWHDDELLRPFGWKKPRRVFVDSMSDTFHDGVPGEFLDRMFAVMALTPQHTYQVLTKRAMRMNIYFRSPERKAAIWKEAERLIWDGPSAWGLPARENGTSCKSDLHWNIGNIKYTTAPLNDKPWPLPNVWLGVSAEDQERADKRIPLLLRTPAAIRFVSAEPLLGPIDFSKIALKKRGNDTETWIDAFAGAEFACSIAGNGCSDVECESLDWVIVGGESGPGAREFQPEWATDILAQRDQAACVHIASVFIKQLGRRPTRLEAAVPGHERRRVPILLKDKKGGDMDEWTGPLSHLRVREFPVRPKTNENQTSV